MPFIPHTDDDVQSMLKHIGDESIESLFDEIPEHLKTGKLMHTPEGVSELQMLQTLSSRAEADRIGACFLGAGCYDHHIPAAVWDLTSRGEFMTAYTPYQAEASQGTLQLIFEYQTMIAELAGMETANASVYDGASGLGEASLMALRANRKAKSRRILLPSTVHPHYRVAARNIVRNQALEFVDVPVHEHGKISVDALEAAAGGEAFVALVLQQPNFFGGLEDVDTLTDWAAQRGALVIAVVNPMTLAVLKAPGQWGTKGADIACGDGQPFGVPMASGGPSFGFIAARKSLVRQMPGRIIGKTEDLDGRDGYVLTLQAREQHIRRGKATSNICTNQGLLVTAATIHLSILGVQGLQRVAHACHANTRKLVAELTAIKGVSENFHKPYFHECVLRLPRAAQEVVLELLPYGVLAGLSLGDYYPGMENRLLVCATEKRTSADIHQFACALREVLGEESVQ